MNITNMLLIYFFSIYLNIYFFEYFFDRLCTNTSFYIIREKKLAN